MTCLLEMTFAGNCGISVNVTTSDKPSGDASSNTGQFFLPFLGRCAGWLVFLSACFKPVCDDLLPLHAVANRPRIFYVMKSC